MIGTTNKMLCDIGAADGIIFSNTRFFMEQQGWSGCFAEPNADSYNKLIDLYPEDKCSRKAVTDDNTIDGLLEQMSFPLRFDLLDLDIDGQDFYVWESMVRYRARIVIVEWSPYVQRDFVPVRGTYGEEGKNQAGLFPMLRLARLKEYKVVAITPVNLICVEGELIENWKRFWNGEFPLYTPPRKES